MTSNLGADELESRLHRVPLDNRWAVQRECRCLLTEEGVSSALLGRIGTFAVYRTLDDSALRDAAVSAIRAAALEYGFQVPAIEPVIVDVVLDIAGESGLGARALHHAATELLADAFIECLARGEVGSVRIESGPPISVRDATA